MLFSNRILCLAALSSALVTAMPRQTAAPVKPRQASTDTIDDSEDPGVSIDNTDQLRNGMDAKVSVQKPS